MRTGLSTAAVLCVAAGTAVADATWVPNNAFFGNSYVRASAQDNSGSDTQTNSFNAFGNYTVSAFAGDGSATTTLDWNANGAHSDFSASSGSSGGGSETYYGLTFLTFTAVTSGDFDVYIEFDWQGSGATYIETYFDIYEYYTGNGNTVFNTIYSPGTVSTSYSGTLVAGREYRVWYYAHVHGIDLAGDGTGSGDITLSSVPLPSASALAGLGLLGLGTRRRRSRL